MFNLNIRQNIILALIVFAASPLKADRVVNAIIPVLAFNSSNYDTIVWITLSNPSNVAQTAQMTVIASGNYYVTLDYDSGSSLPGKGMAELFDPDALNYKHKLKFRTTNDCNSASCTSFAAGQARILTFRIRNKTGGPTPGGGEHNADTAATLKIEVTGDQGNMMAAGGYQVETYNGTSYLGGNILINGGKPF